ESNRNRWRKFPVTHLDRFPIWRNIKDVMLRQSTGGELVPVPAGRDLARTGFEQLPAIIFRAGEKASWRFIEFFTANIRNKNTRQAYARAVRDFFQWCEARGVLN